MASFEYLLPLLIYNLFVYLCDLLFNNGCAFQPACKILDNLTISYCKPAQVGFQQTPGPNRSEFEFYPIILLTFDKG